MKTKIMIWTPKGQAKNTTKKIGRHIFGKTKAKHEVYTNKEDNQIIWEVEGSVKEILKINKNIQLFDTAIKNIFGNKIVKKLMNTKYIDPEAEKELKELLENETKIEIIKEATAQEIVESGLTWWQQIKKKFKKSET